MADPNDKNPPPTAREREVAENLGLDVNDPHVSPANPENHISVDRRKADQENAEQIVANMPEVLTGVKPRTEREARRKVTRRAGKKVVEVPSTGHSWDGIEEYDNPLPRWWLWTFYATVVWAVGYVIAYPAIPLVNDFTRGVLGTTQRDRVAQEIEQFNAANAPIETQLVAANLADIPNDPELLNYANNAGASIFRTYCAQCHGAGAAGNPGYPNLLDNDWLWGGTIEDIHLTVQHGIRSPDDENTRYSEMPGFGVDGILEDEQIGQVTQYVLSLSDLPHDEAAAIEGAVVYEENCAACHMEDGSGDRSQGAPNLADAVWMYNVDGRADEATIRRVIHDGPFGVMPAWADRLSESDIRAVATYVHGLGGGE